MDDPDLGGIRRAVDPVVKRERAAGGYSKWMVISRVESNVRLVLSQWSRELLAWRAEEIRLRALAG